jgi:hypothetical protein
MALHTPFATHSTRYECAGVATAAATPADAAADSRSTNTQFVTFP